jgi:YgiT-type zinc finger domain-containing protein
MTESTKKCTLCGGDKADGHTTFSVDIGSGVVVVRRVPALVCVQCGADWIDDSVAARLEAIVEEARAKHSEVEVVSYA